MIKENLLEMICDSSLASPASLKMIIISHQISPFTQKTVKHNTLYQNTKTFYFCLIPHSVICILIHNKKKNPLFN